jgi:thiamine biosynthesis protein ThiS
MEITSAQESISISVNGEPKHIPTGLSVAELLDWLHVGSDRVAVEMNKTIIRKRDWSQTAVPAAARFEIVEFVGGG